MSLFITVRNIVAAKLCFHRHLWFCSQGGGRLSQHALERHLPGQTPPRRPLQRTVRILLQCVLVFSDEKVTRHWLLAQFLTFIKSLAYSWHARIFSLVLRLFTAPKSLVRSWTPAYSQIRWYFCGGSRISQSGGLGKGGPPLSLEQNRLFGKIFAKSCMKMKEIGLGVTCS